MAELGGIASYELATRRHVEKKLADLDAGSGRVGGRPQRRYTAAFHADLRGVIRRRRPRHETHAGDGTYRRQRLAAKSECRHRFQISKRCNLAGRMARQRDTEIILAHARAIVAHADKANAATLNIDLDTVCTSVETILDKLFDDRGRTLDHFAGGNLIDEFVRQNPDRH